MGNRTIKAEQVKLPHYGVIKGRDDSFRDLLALIAGTSRSNSKYSQSFWILFTVSLQNDD